MVLLSYTLPTSSRSHQISPVEVVSSTVVYGCRVIMDWRRHGRKWENVRTLNLGRGLDVMTYEIFELSPDGKTVAFVVEPPEGPTLWIVDVQTMKPKWKLRLSEPQKIRWSPDSTKIAVLLRSTAKADEMHEYARIDLIDAATGVVSPCIPHAAWFCWIWGGNKLLSAVWTKDKRELSFDDSYSVFLNGQIPKFSVTDWKRHSTSLISKPMAYKLVFGVPKVKGIDDSFFRPSTIEDLSRVPQGVTETAAEQGPPAELGMPFVVDYVISNGGLKKIKRVGDAPIGRTNFLGHGTVATIGTWQSGTSRTDTYRFHITLQNPWTGMKRVWIIKALTVNEGYNGFGVVWR